MTIPPNGNGKRSLEVIMAILALVAGVTAICLPMKQSIDSAEARLDRHERQPGHTENTTRIAAQNEKFAEIETQFKWLREMMMEKASENRSRIEKLEEIQRAHLPDLIEFRERVRILERQLQKESK